MRAFEIGVKGTEWATTIFADTAGKAKYSYHLNIGDAYPDVSFKHLTCRSLGSRPTPAELLQRECDDFNAKHPIGTRLRYWSGFKEGEPTGEGEIYHAATVSGGSIAVWINGARGYHVSSHVEVCAPGVEA